MDKKYAFSIVIPTRNRVEPLHYCLKTCLDQLKFDDYEIVINDNSDGDDTKSYVERLVSEGRAKNRNIKYNKRLEVCSMSENFDDAISRAEGDYVIVIGDDDGIMPMALYEINELARKTRAGIIKWRNGLYNWPNMKFQDASNYLGFSLLRSFRVSRGREELKKSLLALNYDNLPMLYVNSAVKADIIKMIRDGEGKLFRSRSPDVYSSIVLSYSCGEYLDTTVPFTLAGLSHFSNGVSTAFAGDNAAPRNDFNALNARSGIFHHSRVPDLTIYPVVDFAESFYSAKGYHFSGDEAFSLPREHLMRACVDRSDTSLKAVRQELLRACEDDADLTRHVLDLIARRRDVVPAPRLKPANLGADGANLHLDTRDFDIVTIEDAVRFVHKVVWPAAAPLRYDLELQG